jgi:hypothetical protein
MKNNVYLIVHGLIFFGCSLCCLIELNAQPKLQIAWDDGTPNLCQQAPGCSGCFGTLPVNIGDVEASLNKSVTIDITNTQSASFLNINIVFTGSPNWVMTFTPALDLSGNITLSGGNTLQIIAEFSPSFSQPVGPDNASLSLSTNAEVTIDHCFDDGSMALASPINVDFNLIANVTKTVINYALVIDRSGSMGYFEGSDRRIELLSDAVTYFLGLEQLRVQDLPDFDGDSIAIVKYNNVVDASYLPLSAATDALLNGVTGIAPPLVDIAATNDMSLIQPWSGTATGNAVIDAINTHFPDEAPTPRKKIIILFSDGFENVGPLVGDPAVTTLLAARQDVNIYSIGMGSANMASLEQYSNLSGLPSPQTFYVDPSTDILSMNSFFFKIYQNAIGLVSISDPTYYVTFPDSASVDIADVSISSSESKITFSITHERDLRQWINFELVDPMGNLLTEGLSNGIDTKKVEGSNFVIYESTITSEAVPTNYVGQWVLRGKRIDRNNEVESIGKFPNLINVPVGFAVAGLSSLSFNIEADVVDGTPGEELVVTAEIDDPSTNEEVIVEEFDVQITRPDGKIVKLKPSRDKFGIYVAKYPHTQKKGKYEVYSKVTIRNAKGEIVTRDAIKYVFVSAKQSFVSEKEPVLSDTHIKLIIGLLVLLIILMLILLFRKKKV